MRLAVGQEDSFVYFALLLTKDWLFHEGEGEDLSRNSSPWHITSNSYRFPTKTYLDFFFPVSERYAEKLAFPDHVYEYISFDGRGRGSLIEKTSVGCFICISYRERILL